MHINPSYNIHNLAACSIDFGRSFSLPLHLSISPFVLQVSINASVDSLWLWGFVMAKQYADYAAVAAFESMFDIFDTGEDAIQHEQLTSHAKDVHAHTVAWQQL